MYHSIVRRNVMVLFDAVGRGDPEPVLHSFASSFVHQLPGDHALGGSRTTLESTRQWYDRLYRLLPGISFDVKRIWVGGMPWNTLVIAEWDEANSGADGVRTVNHGIHAVHIKWGRITQLFIYPDNVGLKATLDRLSLAGFAEAGAPPIVS